MAYLVCVSLWYLPWRVQAHQRWEWDRSLIGLVKQDGVYQSHQHVRAFKLVTEFNPEASYVRHDHSGKEQWNCNSHQT